jgi:curved DNA-binding protein CbpA
MRHAYRQLALRHHPDRGGDLRTMQALNGAWSVLGDPDRRQEYDRWASEGIST